MDFSFDDYAVSLLSFVNFGLKSIFCLFIRELRPLIFRDINDQCLLIPVILLLLLFGVVMEKEREREFTSVDFASLRLFIPCIFVVVINLLKLDYSF